MGSIYRRMGTNNFCPPILVGRDSERERNSASINLLYIPSFCVSHHFADGPFRYQSGLRGFVIGGLVAKYGFKPGTVRSAAGFRRRCR
jgi:hypothetical protein